MAPVNIVPPEVLTQAVATPGRVVTCYALFDAFMRRCGFTDLTDGMYENDPTCPYEEAQARQAEILLDRAGVATGCRLLDIGCGYGRIVAAALRRGAAACGISVSAEQVLRCRKGGLDVRLLDYRHLGAEWDGQFDAVIANGSLEHFAQVQDAKNGRDDAIYRDLFATVRRLLNQPDGTFVTTTIHFRDAPPNPAELLKPTSALGRGSAEYHFAQVLTQAFGGWYPVRGQLEACASGLFQLIDEQDGTEDYRLTSDTCLAASRKLLNSPRGLLVWARAIPLLLCHPVQAARLYRCLFVDESWNWQFRGERPPTVLLRQIWKAVAR